MTDNTPRKVTSKYPEEQLAEIISDVMACGSCASAPPYCRACTEEADAIIKAGWLSPEQVLETVRKTRKEESERIAALLDDPKEYGNGGQYYARQIRYYARQFQGDESND